MSSLDKIENTIVYKQRMTGEDKGILTPVLFINQDSELTNIPKDSYPTGIYVSQGYESIDNKYADNELFLLLTHYYDEGKSEQDNIKRYWTKGDFCGSTFSNILIPILEVSLPPVSTCLLPNEILPPKNLFYILDPEEHKLYGPMKASKNDLTNDKQMISPQIGESLREYNEQDIYEYICSLTINGTVKKYITSFKEIEGKLFELIDYISDDQLIQYFNKQALGKNRLIAKREAAKLQDEIANFEKRNISNAVGKKRIERLKLILDNYLNTSDIGPQIIKEFFDSPKGKNFLDTYVKAHEEKILHEHLQLIEKEVEAKASELYSKTQQLDKQIEKKKSELHEIHNTIEDAKAKAELARLQIEQETEEIRREKLKATEEELQNAIEALEQQKQNAEQNLGNILKQLELANDLEEMNKKRIYLEQHQKHLEQDQKILEESVKGVQEALRTPADLSKKMGELAIVSRILKGENILSTNERILTSLEFSSTIPKSGQDIVDYVTQQLDEDFGREFSKLEVANILVSIVQSFLTVLAGPPGVGKTSLIVRLAQALHLGSPQDHKNFLYISVARGWVSSRDILGFYNSLNNTYQRARTGLYDFLRFPLEKDNDSLQLVLLDEANLSPMEHYWSDFLALCDKEGRNKPIETGIPNEDTAQFIVQKNTRFIATINNDSTTERLSPRLIDRVPIIYLDQDSDLSLDLDDNEYIPPLTFDGALKYQLFEIFSTVNEEDFPTIYENKLNSIISILKERDLELGQPIAISFRKKLAIKKYISIMKTHNLMDTDTAFDFAISQHILPHIEGYGSKFQKRILNLQKEIGASYPRSNKHIERILSSGNDFTNTYSFF